MADQNEGQTDKDQATLFAALSELRVLAEKNLEKTDEIVMQGVRQIEEGQAWRRKLQEFINRDNEIFEMIRSTYRKAGSDKGYISTGNINGDDTIDDLVWQQYGYDAHHGPHLSRYPSAVTVSRFTAGNGLGIEEPTDTAHHHDAYGVAAMNSLNEEHIYADLHRDVSDSTAVTRPSEERTDAAHHRDVYEPTAVNRCYEKGANVPRRRRRRDAPTATILNDPPEGSPLSASDIRTLSITRDASHLKRQLDQADGYIPGTNKKVKGDLDPENHEIYRLRQNDMTFDAIAKKLNQMRVESGRVPNLTGNAIYGRYKRNAPLIAAANGGRFKQSRLDRNQGTLAEFAKETQDYDFDPADDALLVQATNEVKNGMWKLISTRILQLSGKTYSPKDCASRYGHL